MFRENIYHDNIKDLTPLSGEIEMDETMFSNRDLVSLAGMHQTRI
jgi:hypothetical protein